MSIEPQKNVLMTRPRVGGCKGRVIKEKASMELPLKKKNCGFPNS